MYRKQTTLARQLLVGWESWGGEACWGGGVWLGKETGAPVDASPTPSRSPAPPWFLVPPSW